MRTLYVVMSGNHYGKFSAAGGSAKIKVRSVSWQSGKMGFQTATKFQNRVVAEHAMSQTHAVTGPLHIEEITIE